MKQSRNMNSNKKTRNYQISYALRKVHDFETTISTIKRDSKGPLGNILLEMIKSLKLALELWKTYPDA